MKPLGPSVALAASLLVALSVPAAAGSLTASSAAGGSSASWASSETSDSSQASSDSSTRTVAEAEGPYRIVDATPVPEKPDTLRLTLRGLSGQDEESPLVLQLPRQTFERNGLAAGATIRATQRPYGVEFAHADTNRAFFLLLKGEWHRELRSAPVTL
jgi:hypothetical protein